MRTDNIDVYLEILKYKDQNYVAFDIEDDYTRFEMVNVIRAVGEMGFIYNDLTVVTTNNAIFQLIVTFEQYRFI